ncbi:AAA family ATPase [Micromonospora globbae]|uniref:AAA family ATPase n=1 Tax=Micromonospora globbae TaxID=1894969 RepID=UPI003865EBEE|nr:AAA family ATPase [Micromonospora globbae]
MLIDDDEQLWSPNEGFPRLTLSRPNYPRASWDPISRIDRMRLDRVIQFIEDHAPVSRIDPQVWRDHRAEELLSLDELLNRYGDHAARASGDRPPPADFKKFLDDQSVHLIETQRLLHSPSSLRRPRRGAIKTGSQQSRVSQYSGDLIGRLAEVLARNSRVSQDLDRTFPRRVLLSPFAPAEATDQRIRQRYAAQVALRSRLEEIAVLDTSEDVPLPERPLDEWERRVLWTYLDDAESKLSTFENLLERIGLLKEIVDARFLFKELKIDRDRGFLFVTDQGDEIEPDQLSSGEQHELVLVYDLLFNVRPNSLVLIDEPEISLHVTWQQQFLSDIARIAKVASLRFVIATHSPQIIHDWWSRTVALVPGAEAGR